MDNSSSDFNNSLRDGDPPDDHPLNSQPTDHQLADDDDLTDELRDEIREHGDRMKSLTQGDLQATSLLVDATLSQVSAAFIKETRQQEDPSPMVTRVFTALMNLLASMDLRVPLNQAGEFYSVHPWKSI